MGPIEFEFEVQTTQSDFYVLFDTLTEIGGLYAFVKGIIAIAAPFLLLYLLWEFA